MGACSRADARINRPAPSTDNRRPPRRFEAHRRVHNDDYPAAGSAAWDKIVSNVAVRHCLCPVFPFASAAKTLPLPRVLTASAAKTVPLLAVPRLGALLSTGLAHGVGTHGATPSGATRPFLDLPRPFSLSFVDFHCLCAAFRYLPLVLLRLRAGPLHWTRSKRVLLPSESTLF